MTDFQSRYICYARSHGREPEQQWDYDGHGDPFIAWISARWREFEELTGRTGCSPEDHPVFDAWLTDRTDRLYTHAERLANNPAFLAEVIAWERRLAEVSPGIESYDRGSGACSPAHPAPVVALGALVPMRTPVPSRLFAAATAPTVAQGTTPERIEARDSSAENASGFND